MTRPYYHASANDVEGAGQGVEASTSPQVQPTAEKPTQQVARHTPGPWTADEFDEDWTGRICDLGWGLMVRRASAPPDDIPSEAESEANARLIAAAPDLLEVLRAVAPLIDSVDRMLEGWNGSDSKPPLGPMIHAAIDKAEGR